VSHKKLCDNINLNIVETIGPISIIFGMLITKRLDHEQAI